MPLKHILDDMTIRNAKPKTKEYTLSDGDGLHILIKPSGSKLWRFRFSMSSKPDTMSFGIYPEITLLEARKKRTEARSLVARGINPKIHQAEKRAEYEAANVNTFEKVASDWLEVEISKQENVYTDHLKDAWRSLEKDLFPLLAKIPVKDLTAIILINSLRPVANRGALDLVGRLCGRINRIMNHAVNAGMIAYNPAIKIKDTFKQPLEKRQPTIAPSELPELMKAIREANISQKTRFLIEFQLHTLVRPSEAAQAIWSEVNFETKLWIIPANRMKIKSGKDHIVPLTNYSIKILNELYKIKGNSEYIFSSPVNHHTHMNVQTVNAALKRNGYKGKCVAHGLRSIGSTVLNDCGLFQSDWIETCLAHLVGNPVSRAYNNSNYLEHRIEIMNYWSNFIVEAQKKSYDM